MAQRSEKVRRYVEERALPFEILIDDSRDVLRAYGVWQRVSDAHATVRPALFLVSPDGIVRFAFVAERQHEFPAFDEIARAIRDAAELQGGSQG